ncbi:GntR family transcriptional regulator [Chamaesiphon minutus]|uniref:Transcriptional regulator n=1 Tax=Chamaesiphon minutus (strain ATCC 27169 / PCC 6605) TaxID=1173020 RepID=K9UCE2_CHAP6|nr:GntR family transcriptional regulator [Chamaesiphon minutus]AFY91879.1 transcriptional regulator [Chamaesiphon minutus PCC 6605]
MSLSPRSLQRPQSLQDQAYQALRTAILSGELVPGQRLIETQLAQKLQVSRTPIREALQQLKQADLVVEDRGVLSVAKFTSEDARKLYECRLALENVSVKEACLNASDRQLKQIENLIEKAEKLLNTKPTKLTSFQLLDLDYRFHREIAQASNNEWLVSLLDRLFDKMILVRIQTMLSNPAVLEVRWEHRQIYDAILSRNSELAVKAIQDHLIASQARVVLELEQIQQAQTAI